RHVGTRGKVVATRRVALPVPPGRGRPLPAPVSRAGPVQVVRVLQLPALGERDARLESTTSSGLPRLVGTSQAEARARSDRPQLRRNPPDDGDPGRKACARPGAALPCGASKVSSEPGLLRAD